MDCETDTYENYLSKFKFLEGKQNLESTYVFEKEIGKGAFGYVMCGYRKKDHCSVAIKVLPENLITDWYYSKILEANIPMEILLLALVSHIDGVIAMIEYYHDEKYSEWYIVMERYSKTIDLFNYISSQGFLTESLACQIFYQLTLIIIDCHLRGIIHRDIKEENILIDIYNKKVWLIDFGSGGLMNDDNHFTYNGTSVYAPPEWIKYGRYRGCQLESWSLGIVLYSMLCGWIPFEDEDQILSGSIRFPRKISNNCKDLIFKCLERDPKIRIQPCEIITHPWITSTLNDCDSGHGSFDEAFQEVSTGKRRCSCSCADNVTLFTKEDNNHAKAAIEMINYDTECINDIDSEWRFKVFSKSLSPDLDRKKFLLFSSDGISQKTPNSLYKSISEMDLNSKHSDNFFNKISEILRDEDDGYEEDIDDDFQYDDDSIVCSNDVIFAD